MTLKFPEDIEHMRVAGRLAAELDRVCHDHIVICHGMPSEGKVLKDGDTSRMY